MQPEGYSGRSFDARYCEHHNFLTEALQLESIIFSGSVRARRAASTSVHARICFYMFGGTGAATYWENIVSGPQKKVGFLTAIVTILRLAINGIAWFAPPCSTWVWMSRHSTGRGKAFESKESCTAQSYGSEGGGVW